MPVIAVRRAGSRAAGTSAATRHDRKADTGTGLRHDVGLRGRRVGLASSVSHDQSVAARATRSQKTAVAKATQSIESAVRGADGQEIAAVRDADRAVSRTVYGRDQLKRKAARASGAAARADAHAVRHRDPDIAAHATQRALCRVDQQRTARDIAVSIDCRDDEKPEGDADDPEYYGSKNHLDEGESLAAAGQRAL